MENKELTEVYINETHTLWQEYGEVHILNDTHLIVWNADSLFKDIPNLLRIALEAKKDDKEKIFIDIGSELKDYFEKEYILNKHYEEAKNNATTEDI